MTPQLQQAIKLLQMSNLRAGRLCGGGGREEPAAGARAAAAAPASGRRGKAQRRRRQLPRHHCRGGHAPGPPDEQIGACAAPEGSSRADHRRRTERRRLPWVPLAEVGGRHRLGRPGAGGAEDGAGLRSRRRRARATYRSAWRCSSASATGSIRRCRRCSTTWSSPPAGGGRAHARCGVDAEDLADMLAELRALDPKPGLRFSRCRWSRRAGRATCGARPAAAGRSSSTARALRGCC